MSNRSYRKIIGAEFKKQSEIFSSIKTVSSIRDFSTRERFTHLTIDILEEAGFRGKPDSRNAEEWERIASAYYLPLSLEYHLINFGGYSIYALRGLKSITGYKSKEGFGVNLAVDLANFSKDSRELRAKLRGKVLDFGCSVGWVSKLLSNQFGSDSYGVDIDEKAIDIGRFFEAGKLYTSVKIKDNYIIPIQDNKFDLVISKAALFEAPSSGLASFVGEQLIEFRKTMDEIYRVIDKDGVLLIETDMSLDMMFPLMNRYAFYYLNTFHSSFSNKEWKLFQKYEE